MGKRAGFSFICFDSLSPFPLSFFSLPLTVPFYSSTFSPTLHFLIFLPVIHRHLTLTPILSISSLSLASVFLYLSPFLRS